MSENIAPDSFLTALGDPELELKIRKREAASLDEALKIAQRLEVFKSAWECLKSEPCITRLGMSATGDQKVKGRLQ